MDVGVFFSVCVFANNSHKRVLNCHEYDIGWDTRCDYDVGDDHNVDIIDVSGVHHDP